MNRIVLRSALAVPALTLAMSACASGGMAPPTDLASAERLAVAGRGGIRTPTLIRFGDYAMVEIDRSWTRGSGRGASAGRIGAGSDRARQTYGFGFREGDVDAGRVDCTATASRTSVGVGSVEIQPSARQGLECRLEDGDRTPWSLALSSRQTAHPEGDLQGPVGRYVITGQGPGGTLVPGSTRSFEFRADGRVVAAVETAGKGAVWMAADLPAADRRAVATAVAALLLYQRIEAD